MTIGTLNLNQIYTGNARDLASGIPDDSIDLILCDPVYWQIEDYAWLAATGRRVLKPYGSCIAQVGTYYLFDAMRAMAEHLDYYWLVSETLTHAAAFFCRRIAQLHKPFLWFAKGLQNCPKRKYMIDRVHSPKSKAFHVWGDGVGTMIPFIDRLTHPGDLVFDPFTGGGTVPAACKELGRNFLAFEIDEPTAITARRRLAEMGDPLPLTWEEDCNLMFNFMEA
jgi:DNA modification methylase